MQIHSTFISEVYSNCEKNEWNLESWTLPTFYFLSTLKMCYVPGLGTGSGRNLARRTDPDGNPLPERGSRTDTLHPPPPENRIGQALQSFREDGNFRRLRDRQKVGPRLRELAAPAARES